VSKLVLITGAAGSIGRKLGAHFRTLGWQLRLLDARRSDDPAMMQADLADYDESWAAQFAGVDAVIHLAGDPSPTANWSSAQRNNIDLSFNVVRAARTHAARRVVFASSNWVMAGYRFATPPIKAGALTTELPPHPLNPYGVSKLVGERIGQAAASDGLRFIAFRIGWNQPTPGNIPGPHMLQGRWGQQMWLSDRDLCQAMERAVLAEDVSFAVRNLMSDNPGMPWDVATTRRVIGYAPQDGHAAELTDDIMHHEELARRSRTLSIDLETHVMQSGW
jgi:NAD+ dependent glucose-6-phosphate dehydrogenase